MNSTPDFEALRAAISCRMCGLDCDSCEYAMAESAINHLYWQEEELREIDSRITTIRLNLALALNDENFILVGKMNAELLLCEQERASILDD